MTHRKTLLSLALGATMMAAPAAYAAEEQTPNEGEDSGDKMVCFMEAKTGSHLRKRVCLTESEREARRKADQEAMQKLRRGQGSATEPGAGGMN